MRIVKLDDIKYSLQNLRQRKLRSFLSGLSILIGITAVFALISFGLGIQDYVDSLATSAGKDKFFVQAKSIGAPGTDNNFYLTEDDVDFITGINGVEDATGMYFKAAEIAFKEKKKYNFLIGMDTDKLGLIGQIGDVEIIKGRDLKKGDVYKIVLGYNYMLADKIFPKPIKTGDNVKINSVQFQVIGFYKEIGNPSDDAQIYLTNEGFEALYPESKDKYGYILGKARSEVQTKELAITITDKLRKHKGQDEGKENFFIQTLEDAVQTFTKIIGVINGILVLIALVSVVVASVNIMNTMYTAVMERTKEIGIMKAVGARNSEIMFIFIFESGMLGMIGGTLGVLLGYIVATTGGNIAAAAGYALLKPIFPAELIIGCIIFSLVVGAASGIMPALRASKLKPVDALRYE